MKDTVPAPPVPSTNQCAIDRDVAERRLLESSVVIAQEPGGLWYGALVTDGVCHRYTISVWEDLARSWLVKARAAAGIGAWVPTICPKCDSLRASPSLCKGCL